MFNSSLFDETTFYRQFKKDLLRCTSEVVIESPYITKERMRGLFPIFRKLVKDGVKVYIITRDPKEHTKTLEDQSEAEIQRFEALGVQILLCTGNHHRKLAILDKYVLWEGSLNILSQTKSREIMRRIVGQEWAMEMFDFLNLASFL